MAVGNIIFAGGYIHYNFDFDKTLSELVKLLSLDAKIISATNGGGDLSLVAILESGKFLASEEEIVDGDYSENIKKSSLFLPKISIQYQERLKI